MDRRLSHIAVALVGVLTLSGPLDAAEKIEGRVVDTGLEVPDGGIPGVRIELTELNSQKKVGEGVTTGNGSYSIEVDVHKLPLRAAFSKIGYFARPTYLIIKSVGETQPTTRLTRASASEGYFKDVAANIGKASTGGANGLNSFLAPVSSLPGKEKSAVLRELKLQNSTAYLEFVSADRTYQSAQDIGMAMRASEKTGYKAIFVHPDGKPGSISLYGAVPTQSDKSAAEALAKSVSSGNSVTNVLSVKR